jgi:hypothetical protein
MAMGQNSRHWMTFLSDDEPPVFGNGTFHGTPEEAFDMAAIYLIA